MKGYAVEIQLIEWKCKCQDHANGVCFDTRKAKRLELRRAYLGSFGHDVHTEEQALEKWNRKISDIVC